MTIVSILDYVIYFSFCNIWKKNQNFDIEVLTLKVKVTILCLDAIYITFDF